MKIEIDEKKNRTLIRRTADNIRLKPYFERTVTYKEIDERLKEHILEVMCLFLLIGTLMICYVLALTYSSLVNGNQEFSKHEISIMLSLIVSMIFGIELGLAALYNVIKMFVRKDFREADDLEIINLNK